MNPTLKRNDSGIAATIPASIILHIIIYSLFAWFHFIPSIHIKEAPVYYVDMVSLPVSDPQSGSPELTPGSATVQPAQPPPSPAQAMKLPVKTKTSVQPLKPSKPAASSSSETDSAKEFEERMAHLEKNSEARHEAAALDSIRKKSLNRGSAQAGVATASGKESGSDYSSWIRSRLVDAFKTTIAYQDKSPKVVMILSIDRFGKLSRRKMESSSGDRLFEESVNRAISKAEKDFRPPPNGANFEYGFVFSPQGVGKQ